MRVTSKSQTSKERQQQIMRSSRSGSPIEHAIKQQMLAFVDHSNLEKSELGKLNERMNQYVNRVKMLENENKHLMQNINEIQLHWGSETRDVREKFEQNLFDVRTRIDDVANLKTVADVRNKRAQFEHSEYQKRADDTNRLSENDKNKIKNMERELGQLKDSSEMYKRSVDDQIQVGDN